MKTISIIDVANAMPETIIENSFFGEALVKNKNRMFMGTKERRHMQREDQASDLIVKAIQTIIERQNLDPKQDIDMILTNVSTPDEVFTGCGAVVKHQIGANAKWIIDLHNTGCVSFICMIDLARSVMQAQGAKSAFICCVQSAAGRLFSQPGNRQKALSSIPGDGCGVAYVRVEESSPIIALSHESYGEYAEDMHVVTEDGRKYWEPGLGEGCIDFTEEKTAKITIRANRLVPKIIKEVCAKAQMSAKDIDFLITNQPNMFFLRNWREAIQIPRDRHLHTFSKYANLFGAGIPVTFSEALEEKLIKHNSIVCLAGFSHAGDYSAAMLLHWKKGMGDLPDAERNER